MLAVPGRPEELRVVDVTKESVTLQWKHPKSDGGLEITEYFIEKRLLGQERYLSATDKMVRENKFTLTGFNDGDNYEFRVVAMNEKGTGPPSFPTKPVVCRDVIGEIISDLFMLIGLLFYSCKKFNAYSEFRTTFIGLGST